MTERVLARIEALADARNDEAVVSAFRVAPDDWSRYAAARRRLGIARTKFNRSDRGEFYFRDHPQQVSVLEWPAMNRKPSDWRRSEWRAYLRGRGAPRIAEVLSCLSPSPTSETASPSC